MVVTRTRAVAQPAGGCQSYQSPVVESTMANHEIPSQVYSRRTGWSRLMPVQRIRVVVHVLSTSPPFGVVRTTVPPPPTSATVGRHDGVPVKDSTA